MKVAILGAAGRMGKMLVKLAEADEALEVAARIDVADGYDCAWPAGTEAVVDFSFHEAVAPSVEKAAAEGVAYVIGTTGLTAEEQARVDACTAKIPVVQAANYSLGVNLLRDLVKRAARVLGPEYDVEVVEMHHRHKKDAPSGTALMLANAAAEGRGVKLADVACYGGEDRAACGKISAEGGLRRRACLCGALQGRQHGKFRRRRDVRRRGSHAAAWLIYVI